MLLTMCWPSLSGSASTAVLVVPGVGHRSSLMSMSMSNVLVQFIRPMLCQAGTETVDQTGTE